MEKPVKFMFLILMVCSAMFISAILAYWVHFSGSPGKDDAAHWGAFGDYFGGITNPMIAVLNLIFLLYISFQIDKQSEERNERDRLHQENIAVYPIKKEASARLASIFSRVYQVKGSQEPEKLTGLFYEYSDFLKVHSHLFKTLSEGAHSAFKEAVFGLKEQYEKIGEITARVEESHLNNDSDKPQFSNAEKLAYADSLVEAINKVDTFLAQFSEYESQIMDGVEKELRFPL